MGRGRKDDGGAELYSPGSVKEYLYGEEYIWQDNREILSTASNRGSGDIRPTTTRDCLGKQKSQASE